MQLTIINESRARLFAGGTYFKSRLNGLNANHIALTMTVVGSNITLSVFKDQGGSSFTYAGSGAGDISRIVFFGNTSEIFTVSTTDGKHFTVTGSVSGVLGIATLGLVFRSSVIAFVIKQTVHLPGDTFTINRSASETYTAISFTSLRSQILANSNLILMPVRGVDASDTGGIDSTPTAFTKTYLAGGVGLPHLPDTSSLLIPMIFVNYTEVDTGILAVSTLYVWKGTAFEGSWIANS